MESLTGKFLKGILGDFIFKAAVWSTGCFKSSVLGIMKQSMETEKASENFRKSSKPGNQEVISLLKNRNHLI
ncbi:hypothetical protein HDE69_001183 [Pedobacter cryoconitis]|uniref:Uncharacterized protein n=1 Tax=Pedobacter cryoconitis TaxID=188932 RepID=A0A7W8YRH3_9SPHI|nr:hypothetical protein [Pedobacter cryoconitis]MBB5620145.1 hypothetical protein [Pedobacter cryoconitis]